MEVRFNPQNVISDVDQLQPAPLVIIINSNLSSIKILENIHEVLSTIDILLFRIADILIFNFIRQKVFERKKSGTNILRFSFFFRNGMASRKITKVLVLRQFCKFGVQQIVTSGRQHISGSFFYIRSYIVNKFYQRRIRIVSTSLLVYLTKKKFHVCLCFYTYLTWLATESLFTLQQLK